MQPPWELLLPRDLGNAHWDQPSQKKYWFWQYNLGDAEERGEERGEGSPTALGVLLSLGCTSSPCGSSYVQITHPVGLFLVISQKPYEKK